MDKTRLRGAAAITAIWLVACFVLFDLPLAALVTPLYLLPFAAFFFLLGYLMWPAVPIIWERHQARGYTLRPTPERVTRAVAASLLAVLVGVLLSSIFDQPVRIADLLRNAVLLAGFIYVVGYRPPATPPARHHSA